MVKNQYFSQLSSKSSEKTSLFLKNGFFFKQCTKLREVARPYFSTPPGGCPGTRMLMPCVHTPSRYSIKLNSLFQTLIYFVLNISPIRVQIKPEVFRRLEAWGQQLFGKEDGVLRRRTRRRQAPHGEPWARRPHAPEEPGRQAGAASLAHAARSWQTLNSFCCFPSRHIYLCNVTRSREGVRLRGGEEERNCFTGCPPLRTCCYYTKDVSKASALPLHRSKCRTRTHAHMHSTQRTLQKAELSLERRKSIIKVLIHKKWLPSETAVSSWKKEGDGEVF